MFYVVCTVGDKTVAGRPWATLEEAAVMLQKLEQSAAENMMEGFYYSIVTEAGFARLYL